MRTTSRRTTNRIKSMLVRTWSISRTYVVYLKTSRWVKRCEGRLDKKCRLIRLTHKATCTTFDLIKFNWMATLSEPTSNPKGGK